MDGSLPSFEDRIAYIRSTHELEDQIVELAGHLNAGNYRFLSPSPSSIVARTGTVARRRTARTGSIGSAASTWARRARRCAPRTRVATPENEHYFLHIALHGTAHHVETLVRAYRRTTETEELSREQQQR